MPLPFDPFEAAERFRGMAKEALAEKLADVMAQKESLVREVERLKDEKEAQLRAFAEEQRRGVLQGLVEKYNAIFDYLMNMILVTIKEEADDPYMPRFLKRMVDGIIDAVWPGIRDEIKCRVMAEFMKDNPLAHGEPPCCGPLIRPLIRYTLYPYDRNIFRQIRNPFWWLCFLISIVPYYAISQFYFIAIFFCLDLRDQFQLENYITEFKSFQFISLGIVSAIVGSGQYYVCTTRKPNICENVAPQVELFVCIVFVAQIVFVWLAFLLVNCAVKKGGVYYQQSMVKKDDFASRQQKRDGFLHALRGETLTIATNDYGRFETALELQCRKRMMGLLVYDFVIFLICVGLALWASFGQMLDPDANVNDNEDTWHKGNWKYWSTLFWIRAFYGLMSFPFLLLRIPGVSAVFSHARPTGYNPYGVTVPYLGVEEDGPVPWDLGRPFKDPERQAEYEQQRAKMMHEPADQL